MERSCGTGLRVYVKAWGKILTFIGQLDICYPFEYTSRFSTGQETLDCPVGTQMVMKGAIFLVESKRIIRRA